MGDERREDFEKARREIRFGTPLHKLVRRDGPDTSLAAAASVNTTKSERAVYELVVAAGEHGITNSEVAAALNKLSNATSPRWTALIEKELVIDSGRRRKNPQGRDERVMVATGILKTPELGL